MCHFIRFIGKIEYVNKKSGFAWYSPVFCSRQRTGHCSRHEKTKLSPEHKGQRNDWTCEETLEVSSRTANQDAMLWGELANGADTAASLQLAERPDDPRCTVSLLRRLSKNAV